MIKLSILLVLVLLLSACDGGQPTPTPLPEPTEAAEEGPGLPALDRLAEGWNQLAPGDDTICSNGTDYAFFVRPADPKKLLIYFQWGGSCASGETCDLTAGLKYYDPFRVPGSHARGLELRNVLRGVWGPVSRRHLLRSATRPRMRCSS
jgi:hypothetical protein